jgi:hypothetical protein
VAKKFGPNKYDYTDTVLYLTGELPPNAHPAMKRRIIEGAATPRLELAPAVRKTTLRQLVSRCVRALRVMQRHGFDVSGSTVSIGVHLYDDNVMVTLGIEPHIMRYLSDCGVELGISVYKTSR